MPVQPLEPDHLPAVIDLSLRAWAPVFESMRDTMGPALYAALVPDWPASQKQAVHDVCTDPSNQVWVHTQDTTVTGFVAVRKHEEDKMGEIYMIAVDPEFQKLGIASTLTTHALAWMKDQGLAVAMVETGADPGHAPARGTYEKAGFTLWPVARYFKTL